MRRCLPLLLCLLLPLAGCEADQFPAGREIENMTLMRTLGVDAKGQGVTVTVSSGVQSKGAEKGSEPPQLFSQEAETVSGACLAMQRDGEAYIFYGHVGQILLGEELARRDVAEPLDYVERDIEMRLDTELFVVKGGGAGEAISAAVTQNSAPVDRLEAMEQGEGLAPVFISRTVKNVLADLAQNGASFAPAIAITGSGEQQELIQVGYAVFEGDALVGWAEAGAAQGVNLVLGKTDAEVLELTASTGGKVALRMVDAATQIRPIFQEGLLVGLELACDVEANIAQAPDELEFSRGSELENLRADLIATVQQRILLAINLAQTLDADFLGLAKQAGLSAPWHWAAIQQQWRKVFATLPVTVQVKASIERSYDIKG